MHELSIASALVDQVTQLARREHAGRVISVTVAIGSLSGVDPEALEMAFPLAADGTCAADATLIARRTPARLRCMECNRETVSDQPVFQCGECGSQKLQLTAGRELHLVEAELD